MLDHAIILNSYDKFSFAYVCIAQQNSNFI